jgi:hypothetical protein
MRTAARLALLLLLLVAAPGCVTASAGAPVVSSVALETPDEDCERLGRLSVRMSTELLMSEDALLASAVNELRWRAAERGATHLVVARPPHGPAAVSYGTTAAATGVAYRCP